MKRNVIALTGGIGSGKSVVGNYLRQKGFTVVDCDQLSRQVSTQPQVLNDVANLLGEGYVINGQLNRAKIRNVIFSDQNLHKQYNQIFHTRIRQELGQIVEQSNGTIFVEIPLIDAFDFAWQQIWLVQRSLNDRVNAVVKRDGVTSQNVLDIASKQAICTNPTETIVNDGSLQQLYSQVDNLLQKYNL